MKMDNQRDVRDFASLRTRIVERYPKMSKQLQAIAEFALNNPEVMAVETVSRLSEQLSLPPSTFVRFAQAMDYSGFSEMKRDFSNYLMFRMRELDNAEAPPAGDEGDPLSLFMAAAQTELADLGGSVDRADFDRVAAELKAAQTIFVTAQHLSYPLAALFAWSLLQEGRQCVLLDNTGGFALRQSQLAGPGDVTVAISFAPYQPSVVQQAHAHIERGGTVIAISDSDLSPLAAAATHRLTLRGLVPNRRGALAGATCLLRALAFAALEEA
ncbi:MurR/RpiR family transcriptional regulator [Poseidonocella sp. HB161398]|uniref:MurR/RpiR family transcriptional regulator n=1 Tax=Poseidonocella sp. HB161398 TaxID=2320855 RepID=UPI0011085DD7|nr:MurR/RpiR family transcriptional regulator [Poseidonocella sp. HB161398]